MINVVNKQVNLAILALLVGFALTAQTAFATANGTLVATSGPTNCYKASNGVNTCVSGIGCGSPNCAAHENANPQLNMASISNTIIPLSNATNANATSNEHDFRYGFHWGVDDYNSSSKDNSDLDFFVDSNNDVQMCQVGHDVFGNKNDLTNSTACRDGYVAGWKSWCKSDALDCAYWAATGVYPSLIAHAQKMGVLCIPWCLDRQSLAKGYRNNSTGNMTDPPAVQATIGCAGDQCPKEKDNGPPAPHSTINNGYGPITHDQGKTVATTGPTVCDKSGCEASIGCVGGTPGCHSGPSNSTSSITPATNEKDYILPLRETHWCKANTEACAEYMAQDKLLH
ncbi:MAG: hypothetical protein WAK17_15075 [Candidatus Nitrosopolaris sp.]